MGKYWNREFETMPWPELQKYWLEKFKALVKYVGDHSDFYKEHLKGVNLSQLKSFDSLSEVPSLMKNDIRNAQLQTDRNFPLGSIQVAKQEDIIQVISSSGTTGRPVYYGITRKDLDAWKDAMATFTYTAGIRKEDVVAHVVGTPIFAGGEPYFEGMRHIGATVVWAGGQSTTRILETLRYMNCTAILGTSSFDLYLGEHCKEFIGIDAKDLRVRKILGGGEPGLGEESFRRRVKELWGAETVREIMGLADVMPGMWAECEDESGMHFTASKYVIVELTDPKTGKHLPWEPGVCGEPVYTTIDREATPIIRYRSQDYIRVEGVNCGCARTSPKIRCIGRVDEMLIFKAMNVFPSAIRDVVMKHFEPLLTGYIQVVKDHPQQVRFDSPIPVDIEVKSLDQDVPKLKRIIEDKVRDLLNVRIEANLVAPGKIEKSQYKTSLVRVRDKNRYTETP